MSTYRQVNGWFIDAHASAVWVRNPDHKVAAILLDEAAAIQWAKEHNDHVEAGHHARGHCGQKIKNYERRS